MPIKKAVKKAATPKSKTATKSAAKKATKPKAEEWGDIFSFGCDCSCCGKKCH